MTKTYIEIDERPSSCRTCPVYNARAGICYAAKRVILDADKPQSFCRIEEETDAQCDNSFSGQTPSGYV